MTVQQCIPHREPFLFVDEILRADQDGVIGTKHFSGEEFFFVGHFPEYPVVPGVLLIEAMAQCGGAGIRKAGIFTETTVFFLATVDKVKFRRQVVPGDTVRFEIENLRVTKQMLKQSGKTYVGDELAAEAVWMALIRQEEQS